MHLKLHCGLNVEDRVIGSGTVMNSVVLGINLIWESDLMVYWSLYWLLLPGFTLLFVYVCVCLYMRLCYAIVCVCIHDVFVYVCWQMDAKNLAIMFGPTLIRKVEDDTASLVTDMSDQCRIVESIILHVSTHIHMTECFILLLSLLRHWRLKHEKGCSADVEDICWEHLSCEDVQLLDY